MERAAVLCAGDTILPEHLPPSLLGAATLVGAPTAGAQAPGAPETLAVGNKVGGDLLGEIKSLERARITAALERCAGNQSKAAELLGISRRTLVSRLAEFGLPRPRKPTSSTGA